MREFDYTKLKYVLWDGEILSLVAKIHEYKGRQELYESVRPVELERLCAIARIQSTEFSNRIEGIVTTNSRLKALMASKTTPQNQDEEEILGYLNVLNLIHESHAHIPLTPNHILQLHGEMLK